MTDVPDRICTANVTQLDAQRPDLNVFRSEFPSKEMNSTALRYKNDCYIITHDQGAHHLEHPAAPDVVITLKSADENLDFESGRYLWVVTETDGLHALEIHGRNIPVGGGNLKHSNLTGGGPAHGGGELWYWGDRETILVNAHSGRYGMRNQGGVGMAQALVSALRGCGFKAATTGIEQETNALRAYPDPEAVLEF